MDTPINELWNHYKDTQFLLTQMLATDFSFAIITAQNPLGEKLNTSQNRLLDRKLQNQIESLQTPYRCVFGCSADLLHMEKSWALIIDLPSAITLGKQFNQNAIFYVERDLLSIVPCCVEMLPAEMGSFRQRVTQVSELPDFDF